VPAEIGPTPTPTPRVEMPPRTPKALPPIPSRIRLTVPPPAELAGAFADWADDLE
jgi:hypothetical protein